MRIVLFECTSQYIVLEELEVTLKHCDALTASDDAWLFKLLTKGLARKHGLAATFMAKPYLQDAGNGMHIHFSIIDIV